MRGGSRRPLDDPNLRRRLRVIALALAIAAALALALAAAAAIPARALCRRRVHHAQCLQQL